MPQSGVTDIEGGRPVAYEVRVDRALDKQLVVHLLFDGREGARAQIDFGDQVMWLIMRHAPIEKI